MSKKHLTLLVFIGFSFWGFAQKVAVKTNLLYGAYTQTPNISVELGLGRRSTLDIGGGYNPWNLNGSTENNKKLVHWLGNIEYRYWLRERFSGHFFGAHALGTQYNIAQKNTPLIFGKDSEKYRFQGYGYGGGISYGYHRILSNRWSIEAQIGVGYARLHYDRYDCMKCGNKLDTESRNYFGPTKAGISLIYLIQ